MKTIVSLLLLFVATSCAEPAAYCYTCIKVDNMCHNITHIFDLPGNFRSEIVIKKLGILRTRNILYYSFEPEISDPDYFKTGFINIDNPNENGVISSSNMVINFGTFDIDQDNEIVYLGGSDGIYTIFTRNSSVQNTVPFSSRNDNIISIFFKTYVYFVKTSEHKIKLKKNSEFFDHIESVKIGAVKTFVIDKNYLTIFLNTTGLYVTNRDDTVKLSKNAFFRGVTIDLDSIVYAWWIDGIYRVNINNKDLSKSQLVKVAHIPKIGAMTFDNDNNILFTHDKALYRLTKTDREISCD